MKLSYIFISLFFIGLILSGINPKEYFTWFLEVSPAIIGLLILVFTYKKFQFTNFTYLFILIHCYILFLGGHYTYAEVPLFDWIKETFDQSRNNYDKVGHFAQGFIPAMNIEGAAYASLISQIVMAIMALYFLFKKTTISLKIQFPMHEQIPNLLGMIGNLFIRTIALNTALYLATAYATSYGNEYIAAYTIGLNIWLLGAFMIDGYSSAGNILAGKYFGAKDYESLVKLSKKLTKYGIITGFIMAFTGFIFYDFIGQIFTKEEIVLVRFYEVFWIVLLTQPISAITFIFDGMFKGMGKMKYLRNVLIFATLLAFVPSLLLFDFYNLKYD